MMVTLADEIYHCRWKHLSGAMRDELLDFSEKVARAERFVISDDVMKGALSVARKKPSSLLQSWEFLRPPFPKMWVEWDFRAFSRVRTGRDTSDDEQRPCPRRAGWYITRIAHGKDYETYCATMAWSHEQHGPNTALLMSSFDIGEAPQMDEATKAQFIKRLRIASGLKLEEPPKMTADDAYRLMTEGESVYDGPPSDEECAAMAEIANKAPLGVSLHRMHFVMQFLDRINRGFMSEAEKKRVAYSMYDDVYGEFIYLAALLILMNSKNATETYEPTAFDALNRKRRKLGRKPFLSYSTVDVRLNAAQRNGRVTESERASMRRHWVRGHFKLRKTGCFWWSPFPRGSGPGEVRHRAYEVSQ